MKMFEFSIIASGLDPQADDFEARFYDAGCDDALVAFQKGCIIVDFAREAETVEDAISSAVEDVRRTGARVEHVEPDPLVSLSDIAQRAGLSRAAVHNYAKGERRSDFPAPVARITTGSPLWDWSEVSGWLLHQGALEIDIWKQAVFVKDTNLRLCQQAADEVEIPPQAKQMA
jgi:predicted DNA-binding transcriptional regulator AlpA